MEQRQWGRWERHIEDARTRDPGTAPERLAEIPDYYYALATLDVMHRMESMLIAIEAKWAPRGPVMPSLRNIAVGAALVLAGIGAVVQWGLDLVRGLMGR